MEEGAQLPPLRHLSALIAGPRPAPPEAIMSGGLLDVEGSRLMISGQAKVGKSYWANGLTMAIASGTQFGPWKAVRPRRVLLVQMEVGPTWQDIRVWEMAQGIQGPVGWADNFYHVTDRGFELGHMLGIARHCRELGIEVLCLDPLYMLHDANEDKSQEMKPILRAIDKIPVLVKIIVHHMGKQGDRGPRGTSTFDDWPDSMVYLKGNPDRLEVRAQLRNGRTPEPFVMHLAESPMRWIMGDADSPTEHLIRGLPAKAADLPDLLGVPHMVVARRLKALQEKELVVLEGGIWRPES